MKCRSVYSVFIRGLIVCCLICPWQRFAAAEEDANLAPLVSLLELVIEADAETARKCLQTLAEKVRTGEVNAAGAEQLKRQLAGLLKPLLDKADGPLHQDAALLAATLREPAALSVVRQLAELTSAPLDQRQRALETLVAADDPSLPTTAKSLLTAQGEKAGEMRGMLLSALARSTRGETATLVLEAYPTLDESLRPRAIEMLTQRTAWARPLLVQIAAGKISKESLNVNQVRKLLSLDDAELTAGIQKHWGTIRTTRDPAREQLIGQMRTLIRAGKGDPHQGIAVFNKLCGQCHKIHGQGQEVGPDITLNGRSSFDQLLSNVFDPSLVIGASYQARTVRTDDGRVITGLLAEDSEQRVVLKVQGGKLETIARDDVEAMKVSELSLMPEGVEKQLTPQEIIDLFAFITLDKHPDDKTARLIPGAGK